MALRPRGKQRVDLNEVLKLGGRTGGRGMGRNALRVLVVAEFALALTLLATGGLALRGFWNLTRIDLGIQTDNVLTFRLPVPERRLMDQIRSGRTTVDAGKDRGSSGCVNAAVTTGIPGPWLVAWYALHHCGPTRGSFGAT